MDEQRREYTGTWIPAHIMLDDDLKPSERMLYAEIASYNECFASNTHLAKRMRMSERGVQKILGRLKDKKYIKQASFDGRRRVLKVLERHLECHEQNDMSETNKTTPINKRLKVITNVITKPSASAEVGETNSAPKENPDSTLVNQGEPEGEPPLIPADPPQRVDGPQRVYGEPWRRAIENELDANGIYWPNNNASKGKIAKLKKIMQAVAEDRNFAEQGVTDLAATIMLIRKAKEIRGTVGANGLTAPMVNNLDDLVNKAHSIILFKRGQQ